MTPPIPLPPHLAFERELARDRSWLVRERAAGDAFVLRRCVADAARLRHRWRALVDGGAEYLVVERELLPREDGALALRPYVEGTPLRECRGVFGEDRALQL